MIQGTNGDDTLPGTNGDDVIDGLAGDDTIEGMAGNDVLIGGAGADSLAGGTGDDTLYVDDVGDAVIELAGEGNDRVATSISYALPASSSVERLEALDIGSTVSLGLTGSEIANTLIGNAGSNLLDGGGGNDVLYGLAGDDTFLDLAGEDTLIGGVGDDIYYVNSAGDLIVEWNGQGNDRVVALASYALASAADVETLETVSISGTEAIDLAGSDTSNLITGNNGANRLTGLRGEDKLVGLDGDDVLDGGMNADQMWGGLGNDVYFVDLWQDLVFENAGEGIDRIVSSSSYFLDSTTEIEVIETSQQSGTQVLSFTGNGSDQTIRGNQAQNRLDGAGGDDALYGFGGNDVLIAGAGTDVLYGGVGDDTFVVGGAATIVELTSEGFDRVQVTESYALSADADVEALETAFSSGTAAIDITGNAFSQSFTGNLGANMLDGQAGDDRIDGLGGDDTLLGGLGDDLLIGGAGADTMDGGAGSDTFYVADAFDIVIDAVAEGVDRVAALISYTLTAEADIEVFEAINLTSTAAMDLIGNNFGQLIVGNAGANVLDGRGGPDVLVGFAGADVFAFTSTLGSGNVDRVADFVSGTDKIALDEAVFGAIQPGAFAAGAFATGLSASDADDRIIYDAASGALYYDPDGNGAVVQVQFAILDGDPPLTAQDFVLI